MNKKCTFKYVYKPVIVVLLVLLFLLSVLGAILNIKTLATVDSVNGKEISSNIITLIINALFIATSISAIFFSHYKVTKKHVSCSFGFITFIKIDIDEINSIRGLDYGEFIIYLKDQTHIVISTKIASKKDFINAIINSSKNGTISFEEEKN